MGIVGGKPKHNIDKFSSTANASHLLSFIGKKLKGNIQAQVIKEQYDHHL